MSKIASLSTLGVPKENLIRYSPWSGIGVMILSAGDDDDDDGDGGDGGDDDGGGDGGNGGVI